MIDIKKVREMFDDWNDNDVCGHSSYDLALELPAILNELEAAREALKKYDQDLGKCSLQWMREQLTVAELTKQLAESREELELLRAVVELYDEVEGGAVTNEYHEWRAKRGEK